MKKLLLILGILGILGLLSLVVTTPVVTKAAQVALTAFQGGTGTTSPSGLLYGDSSIRLKTVTIGSNLTFSGGTLSASGGSGTFPFTPFTSYNGTSTPIGFSAGLFTNGSTTITSVGSGFVQAVNGLLSAASLTGAQVITALGFTPSPFSFTPQAGGNGTSTTLVLNQGLVSVGSTTISTLGSGTVNANNGLLYSAGTSTPTVTAPISYSGTLGSFIGGVSGAFSCIVATRSVAGCLSSTDFTTFDNKISSTSLSVTGPLTYNSSTGVIANTGLSTTSALTQGNLLYNTTGGNGVAGVATTSVSCSGNTTCTSFTAIGSSPITISSTGGGTGLATTSPTANDQVLVYNSAGAGSAYSIGTTSLTVSGPFTIANPIGVLKNGAITYTGLATTSQPSSSQLLTSNGAAGVYGTGTSTLNASGPLTGSFTQVGSGGSLGCTTAASGVAGCLNSTDWATFNNKISSTSLSAVFPLAYNSTTGVFTSSFSTTTNTGMSAGNLYIGSGGIMQTSASSSIFGYTPEQPLTFSNPMIRTANNIAWVGLATTSQPASSNLLVSNGLAGVYGVATSSETCSTGISCAAHVVLAGGGAITLATINAGVLGATLNGTVPTSQATSTLYGASTGGMILGWSNVTGGIAWIATSSSAGVTSVTGTWPIISSGGATPNLTFGWATTSQPSSSNLWVSNGSNGFYGVGTSTLTASGPLTGSFTQVGSGGSLGCTTAASGVAGCLNSTDWATFNNKISSTSLSAATPILYNSATGVISTLFATSTTNTYTGLNTFNGGVTIGSLTGPLVGANGVVSASSTLAVNVGGTGSTTLSGILRGNGTGQISTLLIGSNLTFDGTTLSATGGGSGIGDPFTHPAVGQSATTSLMLFYGNASSTQLTSTSTTYLATNSGYVGIGTTSPGLFFGQRPGLTIDMANNNTSEEGLVITGNVNDFLEANVWNRSTSANAQSCQTATADYGSGTTGFISMCTNSSGFNSPQAYNIGNAGDANFLALPTNNLWVGNGTPGKDLYLFTGGVGTTSVALTLSGRAEFGGFVGVGSTTPYGLLSVASSTWSRYNLPLFAVATSSINDYGRLFEIYGNSTTSSPIARITGDIASSFLNGVRIVIGNFLQARGLALDEINLNGAINTGDWTAVQCSGAGGAVAQISADTANACGEFAFQEDTDGLGIAQTLLNSVAYEIKTNVAVANAGAGLFYGNYLWVNAATTTPRMEAVVSGGSSPSLGASFTNATSTMVVGFTNTNPGSTAFETIPTSGCYFIASSTEMNWKGVCRTSASQVSVFDTGISSTSPNFIRFRIEMDANEGRLFYQATNTLMVPLAKVSGTNYPGTANLAPGVYIARASGGMTTVFDIQSIRLWFRRTLWRT